MNVATMSSLPSYQHINARCIAIVSVSSKAVPSKNRERSIVFNICGGYEVPAAKPEYSIHR